MGLAGTKPWSACEAGLSTLAITTPPSPPQQAQMQIFVKTLTARPSPLRSSPVTLLRMSKPKSKTRRVSWAECECSTRRNPLSPEYLLSCVQQVLGFNRSQPCQCSPVSSWEGSLPLPTQFPLTDWGNPQPCGRWAGHSGSCQRACKSLCNEQWRASLCGHPST